ncbi:MAG: metallophosphoesterase, partial [Bacteroidales bacterium]|nr:metallophosphoesterase [Bacteroidales bacterium]
FYKVLILLVFITASYFVICAVFPKSLGRFPVFVIIFLLDIYLWFSIRKKINKKNSLLKYFLTSLYWFPFGLLILNVVISFFSSLPDWDTFYRTYSFGLITISYTAKIVSVIFLFLADIVVVVKYIITYNIKKKKKKSELNSGKKISRSKFIKNLGLISGGVIFSGLLIGMVKWVYDFRIRRHIIRLPNIPSSFDGLKIVQISDLHLGSWVSEEPLENAVEMINGLDPDLVFFTGDLVNFTSREAFKFETVLRKIKAKYGIFATLGNHDYGDYINWETPSAKENNMQQLYDFYDRIGWKLLNNENFILEKNNENIAIIGVENWGAYLRFQKFGDMEKAIKGTENSPVKLLLSHDPSHWEKIVSRQFKDIDLTFAGHTHGFQFGIETPVFKWSPAQYMYKRWAGLYSNDDKSQYIYVNRGTGFIGYPGRIGILPEITLMTLVK